MSTSSSIYIDMSHSPSIVLSVPFESLPNDFLALMGAVLSEAESI
jgi:hypothetical protein